MRTFLSFMMAALFSASLFATTYTVAGDSEALFGTTWTPSEAKNDMVLADGSETLYQWAKENVVLGAGSVAFKVCEDHAWTTAYPSNNYVLSIPESGKYNVTISFDATSHNVGARATKVGDAVVIPTIAMHGNFTGSWADTELFTKAADEQTASLTLTLAAGTYEFGMRIGGAANWTSNGEQFTREHNSAVVTSGNGNLNLVADAAGEYTFTWTYGTNTLAVSFPAAPVQPTINYYLIGSDSVIGAWAGANAVAMDGDSAVVTLPAGVCEFKIVPSDWNWENALTFADLDNACSSDGIMSGDQGNIKVNMAAAGELKVKVVAGQLCVTGNFVVEEEVHTYRIFGSVEALHNWDGENLVDMPNGVIEIQLESGVECQFKVVVDNWAAELGYDAVNLECSSEGVVLSDEQYRNVKVVMAETGTLKVEVVEGKLCVTGNFVVPETMKYYLVGTMTNWTVVAEDQYLFSETTVPGEYMLHTTLTEGQGIKVAGVLGEQQIWYIDGEGNEYVADAAHAGAVVIYFRPAGNTEWSDLAGHIYVAIDEQTGIQNTASDVKAQKFIENGKLFILVNGNVYSVTGIVR